jgi:hypothetical protein
MQIDVNQSIAQEICDTDMFDELIKQEFYQSETYRIHSAGDVEQWIQEFETIKKELTQFLVRELLDEASWDEKLCYEREEKADQYAWEQLAKIHTEEGQANMYTCSVCKMGFVYKIVHPQKPDHVRFACEN